MTTHRAHRIVAALAGVVRSIRTIGKAMATLPGMLLVLGAIAATGCDSFDMDFTAPQVCVEWGPGTDSNGDPATVCLKYGPGSWL